MNRHDIPTSEGEVIICDRCKRRIEYPEKFAIVYDYDNGECQGIYDIECADKLEKNNWVDGKLEMAPQ